MTDANQEMKMEGVEVAAFTEPTSAASASDEAKKNEGAPAAPTAEAAPAPPPPPAEEKKETAPPPPAAAAASSVTPGTTSATKDTVVAVTEDKSETKPAIISTGATSTAVEAKPEPSSGGGGGGDVIAAAVDDKMDTSAAAGSSDKPAKKEEEVASPKKKPASPKKEKVAAAPAPAPADDGSPKRERRTRKTAEVYNPDQYAAQGRQNKGFVIVEGRGTKIRDIEACKVSIDKFRLDSAEMNMAHQLLFKGRPKKLAIKQHILDFNGYLTKKVEGEDAEERAVIDDAEEQRMGQKAHKLTVNGLKKLCDFFAVDRLKIHDKDGLVNVLLDFLSEPDEKCLKGNNSKRGKKRKATAAASAADGDDDEDEEDASPKKSKKAKTTKKKKEGKADDEGEDTESGDDDEEEKELPTDEALRKWVKAYVSCFNMQKCSLKHALEVASDKFGVDLAVKKKTLKGMLQAAL